MNSDTFISNKIEAMTIHAIFNAPLIANYAAYFEESRMFRG